MPMHDMLHTCHADVEKLIFQSFPVHQLHLQSLTKRDPNSQLASFLYF